jgi:hypothetical protein
VQQAEPRIDVRGKDIEKTVDDGDVVHGRARQLP